MSHQTFSERLTEFVVNLGYKDIPPITLTNAKYHMLDVLGVSLSASRTDSANTIRNTMIKLSGRPESTIIGFKEKFLPPSAALANATMAHSLDFDDTQGGSIIHPSAVVVPTALAIAEAQSTNGEAFITATVAGYEVILWLGLVALGKFHEKGFHPTSVCGIFGAALVAGKLKGLNIETICNAMGIYVGANLLGSLNSYQMVPRRNGSIQVGLLTVGS